MTPEPTASSGACASDGIGCGRDDCAWPQHPCVVTVDPVRGDLTWEEIASREIDAARAGGSVWAEFVRWAEGATHRPWNQLRELVNPYVEAEYKRRGLA